MKKTTIMMLAAVMCLSVYGCSRESRSTTEELGHDLKRDIQKAGHEVNAAVHDMAD